MICVFAIWYRKDMFRSASPITWGSFQKQKLLDWWKTNGSALHSMSSHTSSVLYQKALEHGFHPRSSACEQSLAVIFKCQRWRQTSPKRDCQMLLNHDCKVTVGTLKLVTITVPKNTLISFHKFPFLLHFCLSLSYHLSIPSVPMKRKKKLQKVSFNDQMSTYCISYKIWRCSFQTAQIGAGEGKASPFCSTAQILEKDYKLFSTALQKTEQLISHQRLFHSFHE